MSVPKLLTFLHLSRIKLGPFRESVKPTGRGNGGVKMGKDQPKEWNSSVSGRPCGTSSMVLRMWITTRSSLHGTVSYSTLEISITFSNQEDWFDRTNVAAGDATELRMLITSCSTVTILSMLTISRDSRTTSRLISKYHPESNFYRSRTSYLRCQMLKNTTLETCFNLPSWYTILFLFITTAVRFDNWGFYMGSRVSLQVWSMILNLKQLFWELLIKSNPWSAIYHESI